MGAARVKVGILIGGPSGEHDVSLDTGENIRKAIDKKKFHATPLLLSRKLRLRVRGKAALFPEELKKFDIIFNALHGEFGEDGVLQAILDHAGILYTGSGAVASSLGMDKWASAQIFRGAGLIIPRSQLIFKSRGLNIALKPPLVVKPRGGGSSLGVSIAQSNNALHKKIKEAFRYDDEVILQKYLRGPELTCAVLERRGKLVALPVVEIRPTARYEFFDYEAKYKTGATEEIVPARITRRLTQEVQKSALLAHKSLGCRVYSRSDFIWAGNKLYILEINTLPGLTQNSLMPQAAKSKGISFAKLIEIIIRSSLRHYRARGSR